MAVNSRNSMELLLPRKQWNDRSDTISDTTGIINGGRVSVVYYLSRNGHLEHPHFIQVPLSSSNGLYLRDVMNRLNILRGNGMPYMYSWSSKRGYKNGYVWQDLSDDDLIKPTDGNDYILKGSEMLQSAVSFRSLRENLQNRSNDLNKTRRKKHQSWSSFENSTDYQNEYRVYKCESSRELGGKSADMATQTEEKKKKKKNGRSRSLRESYRSKVVELSREALSPPTSMSSSEGTDGTSGSADIDRTTETDRTAASQAGKASRVLIHLMTCGSKISQIHEVVRVNKNM